MWDVWLMGVPHISEVDESIAKDQSVYLAADLVG